MTNPNTDMTDPQEADRTGQPETSPHHADTPGSAGEETASDVAVNTAEFAELQGEHKRGGSADQTAGESSATAVAGAHGESFERVGEVTVTVSAELGRATISIGKLLQLGVGSVLELNRYVSEPVDLIAQGVLLARGEVVVADDRFAIRIKEVADTKKRR